MTVREKKLVGGEFAVEGEILVLSDKRAPNCWQVWPTFNALEHGHVQKYLTSYFKSVKNIASVRRTNVN